MYSSLSPGTILQHRYCLLQVLGHGGFGRTYLAEDRNRFQECCVVKELAPAQTEPELFQKARQLFQREAQILYQIRNPQIPQFREHFEEQQRLFLVQDYVPGKTYSDLLEERLNQGQKFSEAEVRQLLTGLLPVLIDLHDRQMIHRDLSPDNIILRDSDQLPVLVDFGTVKQLANNLNAIISKTHTPTLIGKPLYAPPEQMLMGKVYPSSDLYSLAVTAIVLLTGRGNELYDTHRQTWKWQKWAKVSPELAAILNRMLSGHPRDRYSSGREILALLQPSGAPSQRTPTPAPTPTPTSVPAPSVSQFATQHVAVKQPLLAPPSGNLSRWDQVVQWIGRLSVRGLRWMSKAIAIALLALGRWGLAQAIALAKLILRIVPRHVWIILAIVAGIWSYHHFTGRPLLPKLEFELPIPRGYSLPTLSPVPKRSTGKAPASAPAKLSSQEKKLQQAIHRRRENLAINTGFFSALIDEQFFIQHPEWKNKNLSNEAKDKPLRAEWNAIAQDYLDRLETLLSDDARSQLDGFQSADLKTWEREVGDRHLSRLAYLQLTDAKFFGQFREYHPGDRVLDPNVRTIWLGVAFDYLNAIKAGTALEEVELNDLSPVRELTGTLLPATGKAYIVYLKTGQTLEINTKTNDDILLSLYSPSSKKLLIDSSALNSTQQASEDGYYEIVMIANESSSVKYKLQLAID
jgi:serine/threonine-protein kinase